MSWNIWVPIAALLLNIVVFIYQYKQNYTQNVFQMMSTFRTLLESSTFYSSKTIKKDGAEEKIEKERVGYKFYKFFLLHIQHGTSELQGENEEKLIEDMATKVDDKDKFWNERLKVSTDFCSRCVGSYIDSLVKQALLIEKYMKNGFFIFVNRYIFKSNSFITTDADGNLIPEHFKGEYKTLIEYFRTTIYLEFRLIVLFFYIQNPNNKDYKSFLSKNSIGEIDMDQIKYFLNDENDFHKIIKDQIQKALLEINNNGEASESAQE